MINLPSLTSHSALSLPVVTSQLLWSAGSSAIPAAVPARPDLAAGSVIYSWCGREGNWSVAARGKLQSMGGRKWAMNSRWEMSFSLEFHRFLCYIYNKISTDSHCYVLLFFLLCGMLIHYEKVLLLIFSPIQLNRCLFQGAKSCGAVTSPGSEFVFARTFHHRQEHLRRRNPESICEQQRLVVTWKTVRFTCCGDSPSWSECRWISHKKRNRALLEYY